MLVSVFDRNSASSTSIGQTTGTQNCDVAPFTPRNSYPQAIRAPKQSERRGRVGNSTYGHLRTTRKTTDRPLTKVVQTIWSVSMFCRVLFAVAVVAANGVGFAEAEDESWMKIAIGGQPVGYEFSTQSVDGDRTTTQSTSLIRINRFGQLFEMKTLMTIVEIDEKLRSFRLEQQTPGQPNQVSKGTVDGTTVTVTSTSNGKESTREVTIPPDLMSPTAADRLIDENPPAKNEKLTLKVFSIETLQPIEMTLLGLGDVSTQSETGQTVAARGVQLLRSDLPLKPTFYIDDEGEPIKVDFGMMGMVGWASTRDDALSAAEGKNSIDLGKRTVLKITPTPGLSQQSEAWYRVVGAKLPTTDGVQEVTQDDSAQIVNVMTPSAVNATEPSEVDAKYLASTRWVDWQNQGVQKLAAQLDESLPAGKLAIAAEKLVAKAVSTKSFGVGFATASEVAATREGDCTEHGVLLAAVLRAANLPSRVCFGLVYVESMAAFVPHMWTEVGLDNTWIPLDATRPARPHGGYLKFGDSALDSDAALPIKDLLQLSQDLEKMSVSVVGDPALLK